MFHPDVLAQAHSALIPGQHLKIDIANLINLTCPHVNFVDT